MAVLKIFNIGEQLIFGGSNKTVSIWNYTHFEHEDFFKEITFNKEILDLYWRNESDLFIVFDNEIKIYFDFFSDERFFFEKGLKLCKFFNEPESTNDVELLRICNGKEGEIFPFYYNFLHVVAYTDDYNSFFERKMKQLLKKKGAVINFQAFFDADIHGKSCCDIIIEKKNRNLIKIIFNYIAKNYRPDEIMKYDFLNKFTTKLFNEIINVFGKDTSLISNFMLIFSIY